MAGGMTLAALGFAALTQLRRGRRFPSSLGGWVIFSLGRAPVFTLAIDLIVGVAPPERAGAASAIAETAAEFGGPSASRSSGSIGIAVYRSRLAVGMPDGLSPQAAAALDTLGGALEIAGQVPAPARLDPGRGGQGAFVQGLHLSAAVSAVGSIGLALLAVTVVRGGSTGSGSEGDEEGIMFETTRAFSSFSVDDLASAKAFYGDTLGVKVSEEGGLFWLHIAGGRDIIVYPKPNHTPASFTILNFPVEDIERAVDLLWERGVRFERYDGFDQDERGISRDQDGPPIAWFTDPAGNILSVFEER